jgi:hypothetical protein
MAFRLEEEVTNEGKVQEQFVRIINPERDCHILPVETGFSPKEHQEMLNSKIWLKMQEEQRQRDREWMDEQNSRDHEREERLQADRGICCQNSSPH